MDIVIRDRGIDISKLKRRNIKELRAARNAPNNGNNDKMYDIGENIKINPNNLKY